MRAVTTCCDAPRSSANLLKARDVTDAPETTGSVTKPLDCAAGGGHVASSHSNAGVRHREETHPPKLLVPSPRLSLVPLARTSSFDRLSSISPGCGSMLKWSGPAVKQTQQLVVDRVRGNVFINEYLIIKDLGRGAHSTVKLVYNTDDDMLYAMKVWSVSGERGHQPRDVHPLMLSGVVGKGKEQGR